MTTTAVSRSLPMLGFICLTLLGCSQDKGPTVQQQSKPVQVEMGQLLVSPVRNAVEEDQLVQVLQSLETLDQQKRKAFTGIVNLVPSPCQQEAPNSLAESMADKTKSCGPIPGLSDRAIKLLVAGKSMESIIDALTYPDVWFEREMNAERPIVELWFHSEAPALLQSLARVRELSSSEVRFQPIDASARSEALWELGGVCLPAARQEAVESDGPPTFDASLAFLKAHRCTDGDRDGFAQAVAQNKLLSETMGMRSTPTWYINGYRLRGLQSRSQIQRLVDLERLGAQDAP